MDLPMSIRPAVCRAVVPRRATAVASPHMRIRPQSARRMTSAMAPRVQKRVCRVAAPKRVPRPKASQAMVAGSGSAASMAPGRRSACGCLVACGVRELGGREAFAAQATGLAMATGAALVIGLVAGNGFGVIDPQGGAAPDDLRLGEGDERRVNCPVYLWYEIVSPRYL